jgi:hypothetical protein
MCKALLVIPVNRVVDPKRIIGKKWRAEEEERHKGLLTTQKMRDIYCPMARWHRFYVSVLFLCMPRKQNRC